MSSRVVEVDAITLHPTWAWCVMLGTKDVENRSWAPNAIVRRLLDFKIPFAIHAGAVRSRREYLATVELAHRIDPELSIPPFDEIPRGVILGTAKISEVWSPRTEAPPVSARWHLPGQWGWALYERKPFLQGIPAKGTQGFWKWRPSEKEFQMLLSSEDRE